MQRWLIFLLIHIVGVSFVIFTGSWGVSILSPYIKNFEHFQDVIVGYEESRWPMVAAGAIIFPAALVGYICFLAFVARDLIHIGKVYKGLDNGVKALLCSFLLVPILYAIRMLENYQLATAAFLILAAPTLLKLIERRTRPTTMLAAAMVISFILYVFGLVANYPPETRRLMLYLLFFFVTPVAGASLGILLPKPAEVPKEWE